MARSFSPCVNKYYTAFTPRYTERKVCFYLNSYTFAFRLVCSGDNKNSLVESIYESFIASNMKLSYYYKIELDKNAIMPRSERITCTFKACEKSPSAEFFRQSGITRLIMCEISTTKFLTSLLLVNRRAVVIVRGFTLLFSIRTLQKMFTKCTSLILRIKVYHKTFYPDSIPVALS